MTWSGRIGSSPATPRTNCDRTSTRLGPRALPLRDLLPAIDAAITDLDADRAIALVDAYLARTEERQHLLATIAFSVCKFQNDPHIQRNCISTIEEFTENRSGQRDTIIRAATKYASHATKRSLDFGAYDIFRTSFAPARR